MNSKNFTLYSTLIVGACTILVAIVVQGQFSMGQYDSDSNSDSGSSPFLSQSELANIMRQSQKPVASTSNHYSSGNQQAHAASRNLYNRQQPLQYAPSHHQGQNHYGPTDGLSGYGPVMGASGRSNLNNEDRDDDDGPSSFGSGSGYGPSGFGGHNDDGEGSGADGPAMNLNQAASGYQGQNHHGGYGNVDQSNLGTGYGSGYGSVGDGAEFGPSNGFASQSRRSKSASSPISTRNNEYSGTNTNDDDDGPASSYGPNSASNSDRDPDDDPRGYSPDGRDGEGDDE